MEWHNRTFLMKKSIFASLNSLHSHKDTWVLKRVIKMNWVSGFETNHNKPSFKRPIFKPLSMLTYLRFWKNKVRASASYIMKVQRNRWILPIPNFCYPFQLKHQVEPSTGPSRKKGLWICFKIWSTNQWQIFSDFSKCHICG